MLVTFLSGFEPSFLLAESPIHLDVRDSMGVGLLIHLTASVLMLQ